MSYDDRGNSVDGGKRGQKRRLENPGSVKDITLEKGVIADGDEIGRWARVTEEEFMLRSDEQKSERRLVPLRPERVTEDF